MPNFYGNPTSALMSQWYGTPMPQQAGWSLGSNATGVDPTTGRQIMRGPNGTTQLGARPHAMYTPDQFANADPQTRYWMLARGGNEAQAAMMKATGMDQQGINQFINSHAPGIGTVMGNGGWITTPGEAATQNAMGGQGNLLNSSNGTPNVPVLPKQYTGYGGISLKADNAPNTAPVSNNGSQPVTQRPTVLTPGSGAPLPYNPSRAQSGGGVTGGSVNPVPGTYAGTPLNTAPTTSRYSRAGNWAIAPMLNRRMN